MSTMMLHSRISDNYPLVVCTPLVPFLTLQCPFLSLPPPPQMKIRSAALELNQCDLNKLMDSSFISVLGSLFPTRVDQTKNDYQVLNIYSR